MSEMKKRISGILFLVLLLMGMLGGILLPDQSVSEAERRPLSQWTDLSFAVVLDNDFSESLETYLLEQFPGRDVFRTIKAEVDTRIMRKKDSNGYVKVGKQILELPTTYNDDRVRESGELFEKITTTYFVDADVYYGVIPDKNYFVESVPSYNFEHARAILQDTFPSGSELLLNKSLELEDYYCTDLHVKQASLFPLVNTMLEEMDMAEYGVSEEDYQLATATEEFYGGYGGSSAYVTKPDGIYYLQNEGTESAQVYDYETKEVNPIYTLDKLEGMDDYDVFLSGARSLLTIQNPEVKTGKNLMIFRDSFSSSIAPMLLTGYEKITLVDLRYVSASYAMELLKEQSPEDYYEDVVFLYSVPVLYQSRLKF